jgi:hypothetical protein
MKCGANPALYLNAQGNSLSRYLIEQFEETFKNVRSLRGLHATKKRRCKSIIQFYALLNVFNRERNFMWEREWRHMGDFSFRYGNLVAIIAKNPQSFLEECEERLSPRAYGKYIKRIPIIDPSWHLEEVVEALAIQMWNQK